jgi:hypothetical protein
VPSTGSQRVIRFGDSYVASGINDQTHYKMYNKLGLTYENTTGKFQFFADDFRSIITTKY